MFLGAACAPAPPSPRHPPTFPQLACWRRRLFRWECHLLSVMSKAQWQPGAVQVFSLSPAPGVFCPLSQGGVKGRVRTSIKMGRREKGVLGSPGWLFPLFASREVGGTHPSQLFLSSFTKADASLRDPRRRGRAGPRQDSVFPRPPA